MTNDQRLGRRPLPPGDDAHLLKYGLRAVQRSTVDRVEQTLPLPYGYRAKYDQGREGACVGFSLSWVTSINNRQFYDAQWLYETARRTDEWPGEDYSGTSLRAGCQALLDLGHRRIYRGTQPERPEHGISAFRWARTVDEIRTAIAGGQPVTLGIEWLESFYEPVQIGRDYWIGTALADRIVGGHAITIYGASDRRQAVKLVNTWGAGYPLVWLGYKTLETLLAGLESPGEAVVLMDRTGATP